MITDIAQPNDLQKAIAGTKDDELLILEFWSPKNPHSKALAPALEAAARTFAPRVKIARVNVEEHRMLAAQLRIQGVPSVKFVFQGQAVGQFSGAQPAKVIEEYIRQILPPAEEEVNAIDEAHALLRAGRWDKARRAFEALAASGETKSAALLGLARCHLHARNATEVIAALDKVDDPSKQGEREWLRTVAGLQCRAVELGGIQAQAARVQAAPGDVAAVFDWAVCLAADEQYEAACEALLRLIEQDKNVKQGEAKTILVSIFSVLGVETPQVREYRRRLASALFI